MATIKGVVEVEQLKSTGPIAVVLMTDNPAQPALVDYRLLTKPGEFVFTVEVDNYKLLAFEDANNDQKYQQTEYLSQIISVGDLEQNKSKNLKVIIKGWTQKALQQQTEIIQSTGVKSDKLKYVMPGTLTQIDSPAFDKENVEKGLWQPLQFIKTVPFGLFFLNDYQEDKTPVLFVHGVSGSPKEFKHLIASLDRSKIQPWIYYYPSGFSISLVGESLNRMIKETQLRYGFKELVVIAHSMGGLVTRRFLNKHNQSEIHFNINKYITISTPWGGHDAASMGLKYAPTVIPVWQDIVPNSEFINTIFDIPLPEETQHFLLFGYRGDSAFAGGNSDGVVSIKSQLRMEAQMRAKLTRGYDENHTSILASPEAIQTLNAILK